MTQLTEHFSLAEMSVTKTGLPNTPPPVVAERLRVLCEEVLEPIRAHFGKPVTINSGYRSLAVNKAVKGAPTSQHRMGLAADIEIKGVANDVLARWITDNLVYDQCILEFFRDGDPSSGWVHVSFRKDANRRQSFRIGGSTRTGR